MFLITLLSALAFRQGPFIQLPDPGFKSAVLRNWDLNNDLEIDWNEAQNVTWIACLWTPEITNITGIEHFPNLEELAIADQFIHHLAPKLPKLWRLILSRSPTQTLDLSGLPALEELFILECPDLKVLDLNANAELKYISLYNLPVTKLDITKQKKLSRIFLEFTQIQDLIFDELPLMENMNMSSNKIRSFKADGTLPLLTYLNLTNNEVKELELGNLPLLERVWAFECRITKAELFNLPALYQLWLADNKMFHPQPQLSNLPKLEELTLTGNPLGRFPEYGNIPLKILLADSCNLKQAMPSFYPNLEWLSLDSNMLSEVDVSNNLLLEALELKNNRLTTLDLTKNINLEFLALSRNLFEHFSFKAPKGFEYLNLSRNKLSSVHLDLPPNVRVELENNSFTQDDCPQLGPYIEFLDNMDQGGDMKSFWFVCENWKEKFDLLDLTHMVNYGLTQPSYTLTCE